MQNFKPIKLLLFQNWTGKTIPWIEPHSDHVMCNDFCKERKLILLSYNPIILPDKREDSLSVEHASVRMHCEPKLAAVVVVRFGLTGLLSVWRKVSRREGEKR